MIAPDPRLHGEELIDLIAKTFGGYFRMRDRCRNGYVLDSHYDWQASRIVLIDEGIVTHYGVWGYDMRIGAACVRAASAGSRRMRTFANAA